MNTTDSISPVLKGIAKVHVNQVLNISLGRSLICRNSFVPKHTAFPHRYFRNSASKKLTAFLWFERKCIKNHLHLIYRAQSTYNIQRQNRQNFSACRTEMWWVKSPQKIERIVCRIFPVCRTNISWAQSPELAERRIDRFSLLAT